MKLKLTDKNLKEEFKAVKILQITEDTEVDDYMVRVGDVSKLRVVLRNNNEVMVFETDLPKQSSENIINNIRNKYEN